MKLPLISSIALVAGLMVAAPAAAEVVISGVTIPEQQVAMVQAECNRLDRIEGGSAEGSDPTGIAPKLVTAIDLDLLTVEKCETAGLLEG